MICKGCGDKLAPEKLGCPRCLNAASEAAMLEHQRQYLPDILSNRYELTTVYIAAGASGQSFGCWHLMRIGDPAHALCASEIPQGCRKDRIFYRNLGTTKIPCRRCEEVLDKLIATTDPKLLPDTRPVQPTIPIDRDRMTCSD